MGVEPKIGGFLTPKKIPIFTRVWNHYFHHPFWGTTIFGNIHIYHHIPSPGGEFGAKLATLPGHRIA